MPLAGQGMFFTWFEHAAAMFLSWNQNKSFQIDEMIIGIHHLC